MRRLVAWRTSFSSARRRCGTTSSRRASRRATNASSTGRRPATSSSSSAERHHGGERLGGAGGAGTAAVAAGRAGGPAGAVGTAASGRAGPRARDPPGPWIRRVGGWAVEPGAPVEPRPAGRAGVATGIAAGRTASRGGPRARQPRRAGPVAPARSGERSSRAAAVVRPAADAAAGRAAAAPRRAAGRRGPAPAAPPRAAALGPRPVRAPATAVRTGRAADRRVASSAAGPPTPLGRRRDPGRRAVAARPGPCRLAAPWRRRPSGAGAARAAGPPCDPPRSRPPGRDPTAAPPGRRAAAPDRAAPSRPRRARAGSSPGRRRTRRGRPRRAVARARAGQPPDVTTQPPALAVARVLDGDAPRPGARRAAGRTRPSRAPRGRPRARRAAPAARGRARPRPARRRPARRRGRAAAPSPAPASAVDSDAGVDPAVELADAVEQRGQRRRHVEVVVEAGLEPRPDRVQHRRQRRVVVAGPRGRRRSAASSGVDPLDAPRPPPAASRREKLSGAPVVDGDQRIAERARRDARPRPARATRAMLPVDLAIFSPPIRRWAQWSQVPTNGWPVAASRLGDLVLVVREHEVDAAGVDVERRPEVGHAHRRALDVPAGPARPDRRVPRRLAGLRALPEREVADVVLAVLVGLHALADPHRARDRGGRAGRRPATTRSGRRSSRRRCGRRGPARAASATSVDDLRDVLGRARQHVGRVMPSASASARNARRVAVGELAERIALGRRAADDLVVDVGQVHDPGHRAGRGSAGSGRAGRRTGTSGSCRCGRGRRPSGRSCRRRTWPGSSGSSGRVSPVSVSWRRIVMRGVPQRSRPRAPRSSGRRPRRRARLPVDALTLTARRVDAEQRRRSPSASRPGCAPRRGRAPMIVTSTDAGRSPRAASARHDLAQERGARDAARRPRVGRERAGRGRRGPRRRAARRRPRGAPTSPSEWPASARRARDRRSRRAGAARPGRTGGCRGRTRPGRAAGAERRSTRRRSSGSVTLRLAGRRGLHGP